jgi:hypothetical protein
MRRGYPKTRVQANARTLVFGLLLEELPKVIKYPLLKSKRMPHG